MDFSGAKFLLVYNHPANNEDVVAPKNIFIKNNLEMSFFKKVHLAASFSLPEFKTLMLKKPVDRLDSFTSSQHGGSRKVLELQILCKWKLNRKKRGKHFFRLVLGAETADLKPQFQSVSGSVKIYSGWWFQTFLDFSPRNWRR